MLLSLWFICQSKRYIENVSILERIEKLYFAGLHGLH